MDIPESLDLWTYDTVVSVVVQHEYEPGRFDYKAVLHASRDARGEHVASIRRTTCSMANGDGGYILFGVKDVAAKVATLEDRIVGIPRSSDLRKEFGEKLKHIERDVYFEVKAIELPADASKCVLVIRIPTSSLRPHIDTSDGRFLVRGEGGSAKPMSFYLVREQMLYSEGRLQKAKLLQMELRTFRTVVDMLSDPNTWAVRFDAAPFKLLLADIGVLLQPDPGLLALLHSIGTEATLLNPLLDWQAKLRSREYPDTLPGGRGKGQVIADINTRCVNLFNQCGTAVERLTALFGQREF